MRRPVAALLMNALMLPGMGQFHLGRKVKGAVLILLVNILLLGGLFLLLKGLGPALAAHLSGTPVTASLLLEGFAPYAAWGKMLLLAIIAVWGYSLVELLPDLRSGVDSPRN